MKAKSTWKYKIRPIIIESDCAHIDLGNGIFTVVDPCDLKIVEGWNWSARVTKSGKIYAVRGASIGMGRSRKIYMQNEILPVQSGLVDHIDRDGLNNKRLNLRPATASENCRNRGISIANSSGYKGVCYRGDRCTWLAIITSEGRSKKIGTFRTAEDAARAYNLAAAELFGEYAFLNDV